jgi:hypothetical protein
MKRKDGFVLQTIGEDTFAVALTPASAAVGSMIKLNRTAALLFGLLENECTEEDCITALVERYGISREVAERDTRAFLAGLSEAGLLA